MSERQVHISRGWPGQQHIEEACPCPKERCGYVSIANVLDTCDQHSRDAGRTIRSSHLASDCPEIPAANFCLALDQIAQEAWTGRLACIILVVTGITWVVWRSQFWIF